jgi:prolipoprotein diacylglyceryl transferase
MAGTLASIPSPPENGFHVGPLFVHAYGVMYVFAVMAAVVLTRRLWESRGGDRALVDEVALWGFPAGLLGGRLYHDITSWNEVPHTWWGPLAIWKGGLGIWGGIALGTLAGLVVLRRRRADIPAFLDAAAPGLLVAQAIGRVGNYFNQELFGGPTSLPWALRIDAAHRPAGYEQYATFHPTFLYELLWNLALAGVLVWLWRRRAVRPPGLFALYVAGYSLARIGEELLRVDPAHRILGLRLNFYVASTLLVVGLLWFARTQWRDRSRAIRRGGALLAGVGALVVAGCGHEAAERSSAAARPVQCAWPWPCGTAPAGSRVASIAAKPVVTGTHSSSASVPISVAAIGSASCWPLTASASGVCIARSASRNGSVAPT